MAKKQSKKEKSSFHEDLKGFDIKINEFGEIKSNLDIDRLNKFLNEKIDDRKLRDRKDTQEEE